MARRSARVAGRRGSNRGRGEGRSNEQPNDQMNAQLANLVNQAVNQALPQLVAQVVQAMQQPPPEIPEQENAGNNGQHANIEEGNADGRDQQGVAMYVWLERFQKQKPQSFSSAPTPIEAENWIAHLEKIFDVLGCSDNQRVLLAAYKLEGDA